MNFVCPICRKGFKTRGYLEAHHRKGICYRDHQCEHCQRRFTRKHNLARHQEICNENTGPEIELRSRTDPLKIDTGPKKILYRKKASSSRTGPLMPPGTFTLIPPENENRGHDDDDHGDDGIEWEEPEKESGYELVPALEQMLRMFQSLENKVEKLSSEKTLIASHDGNPTDTDDRKGKEDGKKEPKIDIVCLAKGDYIKKLIELHDGDEEKAMNYIKNVGIATDFLEGDFRLIKKIYFDGKKKSQFPIRIKDYKRNKLEYLEENGEWILDIRGEIVGKRLCENIVSTLLIANTQFNEVIINEPDEDRKELLLDLFQINKTQAHIMRLLERKTQGKLSRRVAEFINYCTEVHAETGNLDNVAKAYE